MQNFSKPGPSNKSVQPNLTYDLINIKTRQIGGLVPFVLPNLAFGLKYVWISSQIHV